MGKGASGMVPLLLWLGSPSLASVPGGLPPASPPGPLVPSFPAFCQRVEKTGLGWVVPRAPSMLSPRHPFRPQQEKGYTLASVAKDRMRGLRPQEKRTSRQGLEGRGQMMGGARAWGPLGAPA